MNLGAFVFREKLLSAADIVEASALAKELSHTKRSVHGAGKYSSLEWFQVDLCPGVGFCRRILDQLASDASELLAFFAIWNRERRFIRIAI